MSSSLQYWIGFNRVAGIGSARLRKLLDAFGDIESAWEATEAELLGAGLDRRTARALVEARGSIDLDEELDRIGSLGVQVLTWADEAYPQRLHELENPPPVLYVRGGLEARDRWAVAVVGTRRPAAYGRSVARDIGALLGAAGVTVVSGLARGIDAIAHQAALDAGGRSIAVLGSGLDRVYPPEHARLADRLAASGALLSDYPLGTAPEAANFPPRNRLIAGLSLVVVVVEAGESSGALITADFAAEQGREVFAVPGSIYSRASQGSHQLIASGARLLSKPEDVLEALNLDVAVRQEVAQLALPDDPVEARVMELLSGDPVHVDELQIRAGLPAAQLGASLAMLELKGRVRQVGGMHYVRIRESRASYKVE